MTIMNGRNRGPAAAPKVSTVRPVASPPAPAIAREEYAGRTQRVDPRAEQTTSEELHAMLGAVLDAIPGAALLVTAEGGLVASNAHARQWLESDGAREEALRAARWRRSTADLALTEIEGASGVVLLVRPPGDPANSPAATSPSDWGLTPREQDILSLLLDGRSNRTIAAALDVGERTVETHLSAMLAKAGVASRAELVARASASTPGLTRAR
jgi:DNA-binding CsgD family transcriptional regulator